MSKSIYKKYNYVYLITEISTGMKYIGSRGTNKKDTMSDLKSYQSSSLDAEFIQKQKDNPDDFKYEILSYHETRDEATLEESRLHFLYDVKNNSNYYNQVNQTPTGFSTAGKTAVKDIKNDTTMLVSINDPLYLSGKLVGICKNKINVIDQSGKCIQINKSEMCDKYHHINENKVTVKDKCNNILKVGIDDPRYLSGELVHINTGKVTVKDKNNNTLQVDIDDHRYLSGELISITVGKVPVKDKSGNKYLVDVDDPRYLSGELIHINTGKVTVQDKDGNTFQVSKDDPRYLSGELISHAIGLISVRDKSGNTFQVSKDDHRYLSGELVGVNAGKIWINDGNINKRIYISESIPDGFVKGRIKKEVA
jgi:uncharacterized cupin superfamily protein